jgi:hypothetical protein
VLETRFLESNWHRCNCKSALIRPLFLYGLPDKYIPTEINKNGEVYTLLHCQTSNDTAVIRP